MKKVKIVFWLLVLGSMGLIFFQNQAYFIAKNSLRIDLWFEKYLIPETANGIYFLAFFLFGLLIAYFYHLPERFRCAKIIKQLSAQIASLETAAAASRAAAAPPETIPPARPPARPAAEQDPARGSYAAADTPPAAQGTDPPERS